MQLTKFKGWRRLWAIVSMYYVIPGSLITIFVGYYDGIAEAAFVGIMVFAAPVALIYFLARWVDLLYQGLANRHA